MSLRSTSLGATQVKTPSQDPSVYISFRGAELRSYFVSHLYAALKRNGINAFIDIDLEKGEKIENLFTRIEESKVALAILSSRYTESRWCLEELVKIKECVDRRTLCVIPIFYKLEPSTVKELDGDFGLNLKKLEGSYEKWKWKWREALDFVSQKMGLVFNGKSDEQSFIDSIVEHVKTVINRSDQQEDASIFIRFLNHLVTALESYKIKILLGIIIGCLLLLLAPSTFTGERGAINGIVENVPKVLVYIPPEPTENPRDKFTEFRRGKFGANPESSSSDAKTNADLLDSGERGAINGIVKNIPKVLEYIPAERTENPRDKDRSPTEAEIVQAEAKLRRDVGLNPSEYDNFLGKTNYEKIEKSHDYCLIDQQEDAPIDYLRSLICNQFKQINHMLSLLVSRTSPMDSRVKPPNTQVFINFRGDELHRYFIGYLVDELLRSEINVFIDTQANIGDDLPNLFKRIEDSGIAIVVFSSRYTESEWCLDELVKIEELARHDLLKVLPIFYKVTTTNVKKLKGDFGDNFREQEHRYKHNESKIKGWKKAIWFVSQKHALIFDEKSSTLEVDFVKKIAKEVLKMLQAVSTVESSQSSR